MTTSAVDWRGVYPAAMTQLTADQGLDLEATSRHLDHMIRAPWPGRDARRWGDGKTPAAAPTASVRRPRRPG